ncbi:MAG: hypothetical protein CMJ75_02320 [Planctomycetaceae bacterium]|nr:hypothetical protein [Planctomycetaceae bacterium]
MAYIPIYCQPGSNTIEIVRQITRQRETIEVKLKVEGREDHKMSTLVLNVAMDQSIRVETGLNSLQTAALLDAALVGLVVFVFLRSLRNTMIVVIAIPLAVLAAIFGMFFTGDTINAMTLGGLNIRSHPRANCHHV